MIKIAETPSCGFRILCGEIYYKTVETYFKDLAALHFDTTGKKKNNLGQPGSYTKHNLADFSLFAWTHPPEQYPIGGKMVEYIEKHNLGSVTVSPKGKNPLHNEHDGSVVYVWVRDNENFERHCKELLGCNSPSQKTAAPSTSMEPVSSIPLSQANSLPAFGTKQQPIPVPMAGVGVAPA